MRLIISVSTAPKTFEVVTGESSDTQTECHAEWQLVRQLNGNNDPIVCTLVYAVGELILPSGVIGIGHQRDCTPVIFVREVEDQHLRQVTHLVKQVYDRVVRSEMQRVPEPLAV